MGMILLTEYARIHGLNVTSVKQKAQRGGFKTTRKMGKFWVIDEEEKYVDGRIKNGKYIGSRNIIKK